MNRRGALLAAALERAVNVRDEEVAALLWSFAYFFCLLTGYYILRPLRDEMGIAGGVENLQWLFTGTFVAMLLAVPVFGAVVARFPRRRFVPLVYRFFILNLLVFFVLACQCMSTLAVVRRETSTWRWPLFMLVYMTVLAWLASFATWQIGNLLGY